MWGLKNFLSYRLDSQSIPVSSQPNPRSPSRHSSQGHMGLCVCSPELLIDTPSTKLVMGQRSIFEAAPIVFAEAIPCAFVFILH